MLCKGTSPCGGWWLDVGDDKTDEEIDDGLKRQDKPALCSGRPLHFPAGVSFCLWALPGRSLGALENALRWTTVAGLSSSMSDARFANPQRSSFMRGQDNNSESDEHERHDGCSRWVRSLARSRTLKKSYILVSWRPQNQDTDLTGASYRKAKE